MKTINDFNITGKRLVIRQDLNVPIHQGKITSLKRLHAAIPTIQQALEQRAGVIILSHLGRPEEGKFDPAFSLKPVAEMMSTLLNQPVSFVSDYLSGVDCLPGEVILCENVRFNPGETKNDTTLAQQYAKLGDIFVMDAFGSAHRQHASTYGIAQHSDHCCAGPILSAEIFALQQGLERPKRPLLGIVGGAKVSSKLGVLKGLLNVVDELILGGGLANTLLAATGHPVGKSLYEEALIPEVHQLLEQADKANKMIIQPQDVAVATAFSDTAEATIKSINDVNDDDMILDIGPQTMATYQQTIANAGTIIWNGPVGVFEFPNFERGTKELSQAIAAAPGYTLAGGGETLAAIDQFIHGSDLNYISTGGGAFLEFLEGRKLPGIEILKQRARETSSC